MLLLLVRSNHRYCPFKPFSGKKENKYYLFYSIFSVVNSETPHIKNKIVKTKISLIFGKDSVKILKWILLFFFYENLYFRCSFFCSLWKWHLFLLERIFPRKFHRSERSGSEVKACNNMYMQCQTGQWRLTVPWYDKNENILVSACIHDKEPYSTTRQFLIK